MKSTSLIITALIAVGLTAGYPSVLTNSDVYNDNDASEVSFMIKLNFLLESKHFKKYTFIYLN